MNNKRQKAGNPGYSAQWKTSGNQPGSQCLEYISLVHGIDVGHGHQEEEKQLSVFEKIVPNGYLCRMSITHTVEGESDKNPDSTSSKKNRFRFSQMELFFKNHQRVGWYE